VANAEGRALPVLRAHVHNRTTRMRPRRIRKILPWALGLIILGTTWFYLAPTQLGGSSTYVVTHGISMEPRFHTGDLAIVRSQSSYHVGEVVAYHNHQLHTIVLHRIVGREGDRYLFKGDNNNFVDPEHPVASQLIGALWIHIPGVGLRLQSIRSPLVMGILLFVGMLLLTGGTFARTQGRRHRQRRGSAGAATPTFAVLAIGALLAIPFLMLALLAFTRSPTTLHPYKVPYRQSGRLSYAAEAPPGPTYPQGQAVTGEPLFTHVLNTVDFRFGYGFHAVGRRSLSGSASLAATVASTYGWHTTLPLAPPTRFHGSRALVTGTLDLTSLLALIHSVETATKTTGSYTLTLLPHVSTNGRLGAVPLHATFAPKIQFSLTPTEAQPVLTGSGSLTTASPSGEDAALSMFAPSASGSASGTHSEPASLSLGFGQLSVASARTLARDALAIILCAVLAALACLRLALGRSQPRDESASIRARYGRMIVPVARVWQLPGVPVIDVEDMEALAQIAEHYDRSILHEIAEDGEAFWVTDESGQFRYAVGVWTGSSRGEPTAELTDEELAYEALADEALAGETLVHEAYGRESYAHEPKLAGPISARGVPGAPSAPLADDTFAADGVTQGEWTARRDGGRDRSRKPRLV
jgi:signal peptidase I